MDEPGPCSKPGARTVNKVCPHGACIPMGKTGDIQMDTYKWDMTGVANALKRSK